ncbi:hypothetical protein GII36_04875 [Candidatus Mycosynbacter amalyticus]|uniref:Uncharacterized protein n=1 Tax=Candidatus Mycosynbacter amalyticus TaxID=2665156 RepID=A0A857MKM4_9BACT|nr:hypothetical protein [Candidatus Mycosynbacter amalyticus]QHN43154.1 hypothetical protein GII36_04875 [Candidatus Mycosynbacter amalyticus]
MSKPANPAEQFFVRYNLVILIVLATGILSVSIVLAYQAYLAASTPTTSDIKSEIPTNFDKATGKKIEQLHTSDQQNINVTPPEGRYNPFSE